MMCAPLLFSRTVGRDYRWIFVSSLLGAGDLHFLESVFQLYDDNKQSVFSKRRLPIFCCIEFSQAYAVFICHESARKDQTSRTIHSLEGVVVDKTFALDLVQALPHVAIAPCRVLTADRWVGLDQLESLYSLEMTVDLQPESEIGMAAPAESFRATAQSLPVNEVIVVPFSEVGLQFLCQGITCYRGSEVIQFAFGVSRSIAGTLEKLAVLSVAVGESPTRDQLRYKGKALNPLIASLLMGSAGQPGRAEKAKSQDGEVERLGGPVAARTRHPRRSAEVLIEFNRKAFRGTSIRFAAVSIVQGAEETIVSSEDVTVEDLSFLRSGAGNQSDAVVWELNRVVIKMLHQGWRLSPGIGSYWWSFRFSK